MSYFLLKDIRHMVDSRKDSLIHVTYVSLYIHIHVQDNLEKYIYMCTECSCMLYITWVIPCISLRTLLSSVRYSNGFLTISDVLCINI